MPLKRIIRFLQGNSPFISNKIIGDLCSVIRENRISLVFSEESDLGNLYKKIKDTFHNVRIICFFHDISADLFAKRIDDAPKWKQHYILECKNIIKQEKVTQKYVDEKWVFNQADAERFMAHYGYAPDEIIPMGAPIPKTSEEYKKIVTDKEDKKQRNKVLLAAAAVLAAIGLGVAIYKGRGSKVVEAAESGADSLARKGQEAVSHSKSNEVPPEKPLKNPKAKKDVNPEAGKVDDLEKLLLNLKKIILLPLINTV